MTSVLAIEVHVTADRQLFINGELFPYYLSEEGPTVEVGGRGLSTLLVPILVQGPIQIDEAS